MNCEHEWIITGVEGPPDTGFISLACLACGAWGGIEFERQAEFDFLMAAYEYGFLPMQLPTNGGNDDYWTSRVKVFSNLIESPSLGVSLDLGTGELAEVGDEYDHAARPEIHEHSWVVLGHSTGPRPILFLQCPMCGMDNLIFPTVAEWADYLQELAEAGMSWVARHFGQPDPFADLGQPLSEVPPATLADLVNGLELFEGDDNEDIPF